MKQIMYRKNKMFCIDESELNIKARKPDIINALYADIYVEFAGAIYKEDYKNLNSLEKLKKVNEFANKWLTIRGLS